MSKAELVEWFVRFQTRMQKGDVFAGGTAKGENIRTHYSSMTKAALLDEYRSFGC